MHQVTNQKKTVHPKETANLVSFITFFYSFNLFKKGYKKELNEDDLYDVLSSCKSKNLGDYLEKQWNLDKRKNVTPSLIRVLFACFGKKYLIFGLVQLIARTFIVIIIPESLGKLISYYSPGQTQVEKTDAYYYAFCIIALTIFNFFYNQNYYILLTELGITIKTAICSFVFRKVLKMTEKSLSDASIGKIVTLITKDVHALEMIVFFGNDIWIGLVQTVLIGYLAYRKIGIAAFAGIGFIFATLPLQIFLGKMSTSLRLKSSRKSDERLQLTQEILSSIKTIKMYAWETFFKTKINLSRRKELDAIFKLFFLEIVVFVIGRLSTKIAFFLLIMCHVWMGLYFTAEKVFFVQLCLFKLMMLLNIFLPLGVFFAAEFSATSVRLRSIFHAEEVASRDILKNENEPFIKFENVSVKINDALINVSMVIKKGLNAVVGHMGSGKTAFLKTILEEFEFDGNLTISGTLSYASQEPWLFPSTIKQNILFGAEMDCDKYKKVLEVCALNQDLQSFTDGDNTLIGDNGVNLSTGQQARINLARAVYKEADIYLLDDCLAFLDGHVSEYIFKKCILDFLKDKICVFVCNSSKYVRASDCVIRISSRNVDMKVNSEKTDIKLVKNKEVAYMKERGHFERSWKEPKMQKIYQEDQKNGTVDINLYKKYIISGGGYIVFSMIMIIFVISQAVVTYSDQLVGNWVTLEQNLSDYYQKNLTNSSVVAQKEYERIDILNVYTIMIVASTGLSLIRALSFFNFNRKASINLHKFLLRKIVNAKMSFFDSHLIGNVLNRFSKDLSTIDESLPHIMNDCFEVFFTVTSTIILVTTVNAIFLIPASLFFVIGCIGRFLYLKTGRSLQRLESGTRSPMIGHLNATLKGVTTIRAFKAQQTIIDEFDKHQDLYTSANYTLQNTTRALNFMLDGVCCFFIVVVILRFVMFPDDTPVGDVGVAMTQIMHLSGMLQYFVRRWAEYETQMTSVERVCQYVDVEQEEKEGNVLKNWPQRGQITYENVNLKYTDRFVLKNINFIIKPRQKIGIVGRTGAGKSSIISTLFRLYDIEGVIKIDNINIKDLRYHFLRSSIGIISQDPVIISGTIRDNIDPHSIYTDEEIWRVLQVVKLQNIVTNLTDMINFSFSAGQKQLICLARALIRRSKIVVLDEPTANLDSETARFIQNVLRKNFVCCTLIIVAHKINLILDSDVVIVVDDGKIIELDKPKKLLKDKKSAFFKIFKKTNTENTRK